MSNTLIKEKKLLHFINEADMLVKNANCDVYI